MSNVRRSFEWDSWIYQHLALDFLKENDFSALFIDTGLGKTIICLMLIAWLIEDDISAKILVVAPVRVAAQGWPNEISEWAETCWIPFSVIRAEDDEAEVICAGEAAVAEFRETHDAKAMNKARQSAAFFATEEHEFAAVKLMVNEVQVRVKAQTTKKEELRLRRANSKANLHIINRESLTWLIDLYSEWKIKKVKGVEKRKRVIVGWPYRTVFLDESSSFKDHKSARFKALVSVRAQGFIDRLHELTATPAAESYLGLFAQLYLMDRGERLGNNITAYKEEFFVQGRFHQAVKLRRGAEEEISDRIADLCLVMKSKDYLDEIDPLFLPRRLRMTPTEMTMYREFEREFVLTLPDGEVIEAETAASLSGKLLQLASGAVYNKDKQVRHVHEHKIEDLKELAEELAVAGEPLLVAYWYKSSLARLKKAFPKAAIMDTSGKIVKPWNDGKVGMLLMHPAGAAHGLNMQYGPGHDVYFFDACWSYELFYQLYRRLHRQGQKRQVRIHLPQMIGTNDVLVFDRLTDKEDAQEILFNRVRALHKRWKELQMQKEAA